MTLAPLQSRSYLLAVPAGMLGLWILVLLGGDGRLDALRNPLGADFAMFYQAGQAASQGQWDELYNEALQQQQLLANFPGLPADTYLPYRYPPVTAMVLAPLGTLPHSWAWLIFLTLGLTAWAFSWRALARSTTGLHTSTAQAALWSLLFSPILAQSLIDGQASLFWFAIAAATYVHIQKQRWMIAGAILALAALKPNVMALLAVMWIVRYPKLLLGLIPSAAALVTAMWLVTGGDCISAYVDLARQLATGNWPVETPYWKVQSLLSWTHLLAGDYARTVNMVLGIGLAGWLGMQRERGDNAQQRSYLDTCTLCGGLIINALFNPYTPVYDLTLLSLGMFAVLAHACRFGSLDELASRRDVQLAWLCLWLGPIISQSVSSALASPYQLMPVWLLCLGIIGAAWHWKGSGSASASFAAHTATQPVP